MGKIALVVLLCASSLAGATTDAPVVQARWPQPAERFPVWQGSCPASYTSWVWAKGRNPVCIQNI
jgi:hypothetical protein